ncbi:MAG: protease modulator HflC, partial [Kordiimonas sp.]
AAANDVIANDLLEKIMDTTVRNVLAKQPMNNIVSGERASLMQEISAITNERAASIGLEVIDVRLKRVDLPAQNSQAIFQRMETERQQEAAEKRAEGRRDAIKIRADADRQSAVIVAEAGKQSQIIRGEADGQAVKIFAEAFGKDEEFFEFYRTMEAYRKSLGQDDTRLILSPDSEFFKLFVNSDTGK